MDEQKPHAEQQKAPELKRPDEAVKDLEPDPTDGEAVKGGSLNFQKIKID